MLSSLFYLHYLQCDTASKYAYSEAHYLQQKKHSGNVNSYERQKG